MTSELPLIRGGGGMDLIPIDLNRDGFTDFVANDSDWPNGRILTNIIGWVYQPDTGQYVESLAIRSDPVFSFPSLRSHVNDFNRDGLDDLYVVTYGDEHRQGAGGYDALFYSQPDGSFTDGRGTPSIVCKPWVMAPQRVTSTTMVLRTFWCLGGMAATTTATIRSFCTT